MPGWGGDVADVVTYCGLYEREQGRQVVHGVADEVLRRMSELGGISEPTRFTAVSVVFDPELLKVVLDDICREAGVVVRLHTLLTGASTVHGTVHSVGLTDHSGSWRVDGASFVDATGEADLATLAGAEVRYGTGGRVQNGTLGVRFGGIPGQARVDRDTLGSAVRAARSRGERNLPHDPGLVVRMPVSGDIVAYLIDAEYDARDALDTSRAEADARRLAYRYLAIVRSVPGCENAYIVTTGPELGTRESRHIVAPRVLTQGEVLEPRGLTDAVAVGAWPMEYHPGAGLASEWNFIGPPGFYGIALDCLRSVNVSNLFAAGRTMDGDRGASSSLRVMGTAFATGQAAGVAAALTIRDGFAQPSAVRSELDRQGAHLPVAPTTTILAVAP